MDVLRMKMIGANPKPLLEGVDPSGSANYFIGEDPAKWRAGVLRYRGIRYHDLYPGVDIIYGGNQGELGWEIILKRGARVDAVKFRFDGAERLELNSKGDLIIKLSGGEVRQQRPVIRQVDDRTTKRVEARFVLTRKREIRLKTVSFDAGEATNTETGLSYSTFFGRSFDTEFVDMDFFVGGFRTKLFVDSSNNLYLVGETISADFPTTENAFAGNIGQLTDNQRDIFISKVDASKTGVDSLVYSTFIGSSGDEMLQSAFVDASGSVFLVGTTFFPGFPATEGFPTTENAFSREQIGSTFVARIDTAKSGKESLAYSTYFGGDAGEFPTEIVFEMPATVVVAGVTSSNNIPTTEGAYQPGPRSANRRDLDVFVSRIDTSKNGKDSLAYSTYFGGEGLDSFDVILLDHQNIYLAGDSESKSFPTTGNAFQKSPVGGSTDFFLQIDTSKSGNDSLVYSTYFGSGKREFFSASDFRGITKNSSGDIYLVGETRTNDLPTTPTAYDSGPRETKRTDIDIFISRINTSKNGMASLVYSTYLGGHDNDLLSAFYINPDDDVYTASDSRSNDFPSTENAFRPGPRPPTREDEDIVLSKLDTSAVGKASLVYSTYFGGTGGEFINRLYVDRGGNVYLAGDTTSSDLKTTPNAFRERLKKRGFGFSVFAAKIDASREGESSLIYSTYLAGNDDTFLQDFFVDSEGSLYAVGVTAASDFPTHLAFQAINGGYFFEDAFVSKLDANGLPVYSTYLGDRGTDAPLASVLDSLNNLYVYGLTRSPDFPVTGTGYLTSRPSNINTFIAKISEPPRTGRLRITSTSVIRDTLLVVGEGFVSGAVILVDDAKLSTTASRHDETLLISTDVGRVKQGKTVTIRVRNPDGSLSESVEFTRRKRRIL